MCLLPRRSAPSRKRTALLLSWSRASAAIGTDSRSGRVASVSEAGAMPSGCLRTGAVAAACSLRPGRLTPGTPTSASPWFQYRGPGRAGQPLARTGLSSRALPSSTKALRSPCCAIVVVIRLRRARGAKPRDVLKDRVVGHQRDAETDGRGGEQAVRVVRALRQRVADAPGVGPELGVDHHELRAAVNDLDLGQAALQGVQTRRSPASIRRSIPNLGGGLEGDEGRTPRDDRRIALGQRRPADELRAEHIRVDDDRPRGAAVTT